MKVSILKYGKNNPRKISKESLAKLVESIGNDPQFMVLRPMVIDENNEVIGGNQRLKAIKQLGMKEIPDNWVVAASNLTDEQKKRFILVDNAPAGMSGEWDVDLLAEHWEVPELAALGFDVEALGFAKNEELEAGAEIETIPEKFMIVIDCGSESEQVSIIEKLQVEGIECRALIS